LQGKNRSLQYKTEENENRKQKRIKTENKIVEKQKAKENENRRQKG